MQSKRADFIALLIAFLAAIGCALLVAVAHAANAALLLELLAGGVLGFVFPRGAWRWAIILAAWVPVLFAFRIPFAASNLSWCPQNAVAPSLVAWSLVIAAVLAVVAGVACDWIVSQTLRWLQFLNVSWLDRVKPALRVVALALGALIVLASAALLAQPLHPYSVGQNYCWDEYCFVVMQVNRAKTIGVGPHRATAHGTFYIVTADMQSPYWGRFTWGNDAVYAIDYDGTDYSYSPAGQQAVDFTLGSRRSSCHEIRGAGETETIVFDLPRDVIQPRLLVRDTLGLQGLLGGLRLNLFYVKPAFNLRYD